MNWQLKLLSSSVRSVIDSSVHTVCLTVSWAMGTNGVLMRLRVDMFIFLLVFLVLELWRRPYSFAIASHAYHTGSWSVFRAEISTRFTADLQFAVTMLKLNQFSRSTSLISFSWLHFFLIGVLILT